MIDRIHQKLGTAGLVIAIVALVAALGGTAIAASGALTGKQKKEVEKIAKKYAGKPGAAGAAGPAGPAGPKGDSGPKGDTGAQGKEGPQGKQGIQGVQGKPGETGFTDTLPPGKTETGAWNLFLTSTTESSPGSETTISFPIPLEEKSEKAFLFNAEETQFEEFGKDEGQSCVVGEPECVPTGCEGTIEDPTAAPGVLCIYTTEELAEEHTSGRLRARQLIGGALGYSKSGALLNGIFIQGTTENPAIYEAHGSWAVEAPPAP